MEAASGEQPPGRQSLRVLLNSTLGDSRVATMGGAWQALWTSRLLVWIAGLFGMVAIGFQPGVVGVRALAPFGALGNLLVSPAARWDAGWYLSIAEHPYQSAPQAAFFPLYPLSMRALAPVVGSALVAGIVVSMVAFAVALYLLGRLVALKLGSSYARPAMLVLAFFPTALFFSAVYSESLFLMLTIGAVYAARTERWAWAGVLGGLASATRNTGVLILLTLVILYLYGPRQGSARSGVATAGWRPRYALRWNLLWLALVPAGLVAFLTYMGLAHGDALAPVHATQTYWHRQFQLLSGISPAVSVVWHSLHQIASAPPSLNPSTNLAFRTATSNVVDACFLIFAVLASIGVLRRLPLAYGAYCVVSLAFMVSAPTVNEPLASVPRYVAVLFPLQMWLALWAAERRRLAVCLGCSGVMLGMLTVQFATWRWVA